MLILASGSPRRRELLLRLGIPFRIEPADAGEVAVLPDPRQVPLYNAELKAAAVAVNHPADPVLGADTVILFEGRVIGKPRDPADALAILMELSGRTHEVVTGLALLRSEPELRRVWSETTRVTFLPFDVETAKRYLSLVPVLDKAGAYAIQEHGELLVASIDGDLDNVVGLPLGRLQRELAALESCSDHA